MSRRLTADMYEIADTETGETMLRDFNGIYHMVVDLGRSISGVRVDEVSAYGEYRKQLRDVQVYQPKSTLTAMQIKAQVILGVRICIYNDEITRICIDESVAKPGTRIRLSNFASSMSCWAFSGSPLLDSTNVIIVLDDNIELKGDVLKFMWCGFSIDISEVTNKRTRSAVLSSVNKVISLASPSSVKSNYVIDRSSDGH